MSGLQERCFKVAWRIDCRGLQPSVTQSPRPSPPRPAGAAAGPPARAGASCPAPAAAAVCHCLPAQDQQHVAHRAAGCQDAATACSHVPASPSQQHHVPVASAAAGVRAPAAPRRQRHSPQADDAVPRRSCSHASGGSSSSRRCHAAARHAQATSARRCAGASEAPQHAVRDASTARDAAAADARPAANLLRSGRDAAASSTGSSVLIRSTLTAHQIRRQQRIGQLQNPLECSPFAAAGAGPALAQVARQHAGPAPSCRDGSARPGAPSSPSMSVAPLVDHALDVGDRARRIQVLRAGLGAVHDGVAAIQPERIFQRIQPLAGGVVAAVDDPAIRGQQRGRAPGSGPNSTSSSGRRWSSRRTGCRPTAGRSSPGLPSTDSARDPVGAGERVVSQGFTAAYCA